MNKISFKKFVLISILKKKGGFNKRTFKIYKYFFAHDSEKGLKIISLLQTLRITCKDIQFEVKFEKYE